MGRSEKGTIIKKDDHKKRLSKRESQIKEKETIRKRGDPEKVTIRKRDDQKMVLLRSEKGTIRKRYRFSQKKEQ
jgi:hypothetical protein